MSQEQIVVQRPSFLSSRSSQEDILKLLDRLEELAENTHSFFGRAWGMNLEEFHMLTNKIRASLPEEVRRASRVTNDSDKIVSAAKEEAELTIEQAKEEAARVVNEARGMADKLIDQSEINRLAKAQAQEIMANAEGSAKETMRGADEYAREVLTAIENHLAKVMGALQKGREKLETRMNREQQPEPPVLAGRRR
jgi:cell division septum initiation protein DivIVA